MDHPFLEPVELRAHKDGSSIGLRLTRETADAERADLVRLGWSVEIAPLGTIPERPPVRVSRAGSRAGVDREARRRRHAVEARIAVQTRAVQEHLQEAWERADLNRLALDGLRRRVRRILDAAPR
jgi:hypothetical protein